jgi:hypothetical protein
MIGVLAVASVGGTALYLYVRSHWKMMLGGIEDACWFVVGLAVVLLYALAFTGWAWEEFSPAASDRSAVDLPFPWLADLLDGTPDVALAPPALPASLTPAALTRHNRSPRAPRAGQIRRPGGSRGA